jgi:hypothetical protein
MTKYILKDAKCIKFYDENPNIDFNTVNALMIDFITQTMLSADNSKLDAKKIQKILKSQDSTLSTHQKKMEEDFSNFREIQKTSMQNLNENLKKLEHHQESSRDTIDHVHRTLSTNNSEFSKIISDQLQISQKKNLEEVKSILKYNSHDLSEKNQERLEQYIKSLSNPTDNILESLNKILDNKNSNLLNNIQQPIFTHLSTSEDRITKSLSDIKEQTSLFEEIKEHFEKQNNSSYKGQQSETKLDIILNSIFPSATISNTTGIPHSGDFIVDRGENKQKILFENKDYSTNVNPTEIEKFITDCEKQNCCGIFLSQNSGITRKENYQIDIHKGNILVYVHNTNYDQSKIYLAMQIVDSLYNQLKKKDDDEEISISEELLERINAEHKQFLSQKKELLSILRESNKKLNSQIESFQLPSIQYLLADHFAQVESNNFSCDICSTYVAKNARGLAAHKRGCIKKFANLAENTTHTIQTTPASELNLSESNSDQEENNIQVEIS